MIERDMKDAEADLMQTDYREEDLYDEDSGIDSIPIWPKPKRKKVSEK
jgi:hypothetical protein